MKSWAGNVAEEVGSTNGLVDQMQLDISMKKEVAKWHWLMLDIVDGEFNLPEENWRECLPELQLIVLSQVSTTLLYNTGKPATLRRNHLFSIYRAFWTPKKLSRLRQDNVVRCKKCGSASADDLHMFFYFPLLRTFWQEVGDAVNVILPSSPKHQPRQAREAGHNKVGKHLVTVPPVLTPPTQRDPVARMRRSAVAAHQTVPAERPRRPFRLSRWAGGRPPEDRRPAQWESPFNNEAGLEWSRRSCRGATGAVAPVAIFTVCTADSETLCGALLGGPTAPVPAILVLAVGTARNRLAGRRSESPWRCCKQRRHGGFPGPAGNRRETAGSPFLTAALPPRSESPRKHRQPVGGASAALRHGGHGPPGSE
ncbi:hypothetical protein NDU88_007292 [Pleurodeles waltl]|uniref:Reverse transcriptase zinc-binding domain-containing protein n=1 Tax=Pleurodeles waltl TaxID=8319 RepID=A0AAV7RSI8_PLEWA|nr:hypothetical protein NDU88_007292 [Pleurodeles waltl]